MSDAFSLYKHMTKSTNQVPCTAVIILESKYKFKTSAQNEGN
jgi:hypothetical protein